jgi:hypothetical protein
VGTGTHADVARIYRLMGRTLAPYEMWEDSLDRLCDAIEVEEELNVNRENWGIAVTLYVNFITFFLLPYLHIFLIQISF